METDSIAESRGIRDHKMPSPATGNIRFAPSAICKLDVPNGNVESCFECSQCVISCGPVYQGHAPSSMQWGERTTKYLLPMPIFVIVSRIFIWPGNYLSTKCVRCHENNIGPIPMTIQPQAQAVCPKAGLACRLTDHLTRLPIEEFYIGLCRWSASGWAWLRHGLNDSDGGH